MFISTDFTYNGISSTDMHLLVSNVNNSGLLEVPFGVSQSINEEKIKGRLIPYKYGINREPLSFTVTLCLEDNYKWDDDFRKSVVQWLFQEDYAPFISDDHPDIVYYCIPTGDVKRYDNWLQQGYTTITFRCDAPWGWSYPQAVADYDFSDLTTPQTIQLANDSNIVKYYYPEVQIEVTSSMTVTLKNITDAGREFTFTGLQVGERVYINNAMQEIVSSLTPVTYRLGNFNKNWLRLVPGVNYIEIENPCKLEFRNQFPIAL